MSEQPKGSTGNQRVKVIPAISSTPNTPQTPGMNRAAAINFARVGAQKIWAARPYPCQCQDGAHHHGALESVIYVLKGRARMRWGEHLEYVAEANPGDYLFIRPMCRTRRSMPQPTKPWNACWAQRQERCRQPHIEPVEKPEEVRWIDPIHRHG